MQLKFFIVKNTQLILKKKLGKNSKQTIKTDKLGRFKVRFLIDKTTIKF